MSRIKSANQRLLSRSTLTILFTLIIMHLVGSPLINYYWLRDNNGPALTPGVDYRVNWISDADFRGLDRTGQPEYASETGNKTYAAGATWQLFRPYYVSTPDGKWHVEVSARGPMTPYSLRAYFGAVVTPLACSIIGLIICLYGRKADSFSEAEKPDRSLSDLD